MYSPLALIHIDVLSLPCAISLVSPFNFSPPRVDLNPDLAFSHDVKVPRDPLVLLHPISPLLAVLVVVLYLYDTCDAVVQGPDDHAVRTVNAGTETKGGAGYVER